MQKVNIMIVEDQFIVAEDIRRNLVGFGYEVTNVVKTGEEAIKLVRQEPPDLVLLDIALGDGIDGIGTARAIREVANIPIIYVTAYSDPKTFDRAKRTEPHAYIVKPFDFSNLHAAIELALFNFSRNTFGQPGDLTESARDPVGNPKPEHFIFSDTIFIKVGKAFQKVIFKDIHFVKAQGSYSLLRSVSREFTLSVNLRTVQERLDAPEFFRVHRSYIVNLHNIDRIEEGGVRIGDALIPTSRRIHNELLSKFQSI